MSSAPFAASTATSAAFQLGPLALVALLYARRVRTLALGANAVPGWRQACFYSGFVVIGAALTSLLPGIVSGPKGHVVPAAQAAGLGR